MGEVDPELLGRLWQRYGAALVLYARGWCDTPDEVVQEAFLKLVQQRAAPENVAGWLFRVVRNQAVSVARSARRRRRREQSAAKGESCWFSRGEASAVDAAEVTAALRDLPAEQREAIVARIWGSLGFELMGCSTATAYRRYVAGLETLRERLGAKCPLPGKNSR